MVAATFPQRGGGGVVKTVEKLSCNIFQESLKEVATTLSQKHYGNIHSFRQSATIFTML